MLKPKPIKHQCTAQRAHPGRVARSTKDTQAPLSAYFSGTMISDGAACSESAVSVKRL